MLHTRSTTHARTQHSKRSSSHPTDVRTQSEGVTLPGCDTHLRGTVHSIVICAQRWLPGTEHGSRLQPRAITPCYNTEKKKMPLHHLKPTVFANKPESKQAGHPHTFGVVGCNCEVAEELCT